MDKNYDKFINPNLFYNSKTFPVKYLSTQVSNDNSATLWLITIPTNARDGGEKLAIYNYTYVLIL